MFVIEYFIWHYLRAPKKIIEIWVSFLQFFFFYFIPVPQLTVTLFAPWKKDVVSYGRGFDPKKFIETLAFNLISRAIGAIVRIFAIAFAFGLELITLVSGLAFLFFWIFWPFFLASSIAIGGFFLLKTEGQIKSFLILVFDIGTILLFILFFKKSRQKSPEQLNLKEIIDQDWSSLIWERAGLKKEQVPDDLLDNPQGFLDNFLKSNSIAKEDFLAALEWEVLNRAEKTREKKFWEKQNLFSKKSFAVNWVYGWTNNLDSYSQELKGIKNSAQLVGRQKEIDAIERILCRPQQSNVLIVGEPGVGKKTLINQLAKMIEKGTTAAPLAYKRVIELDLNLALAGLIAEGEIKQRLIKIFNESSWAGNIILVIDDFHNFISPQAGETDISPILIPFLENAHFKIMALTTYDALHDELENKPDILRFFEKVEIKEPEDQQTLLILEELVPELEKRTKKRITIQALKEIIKTSSQYISDSPMPEKAIDLLEETTLQVANNTKDYFVLPKHVDLVVSQKTEIPIGELETDEKQKLGNLEEFLHKRVVDQESAIKEVASAMRRARLGIAAKNRPMGSFLFLGPTGVGKTETAKALAETYFGSEERMLRFDMSEYQGPTAVERMIGSGISQKAGNLTTAVKENPFSLLLLDEIEKADPEIINLFLQVLDEGRLTDAFGKKINFRNLIIIATSNASAELIREMVKQGIDPSESKQKILDFIQQSNIFRPEFLNRFDGIVVFRPLSKEDTLKISQLLLNGLTGRLANQGLTFEISKELVEKIAQLGYDPTNGARAMRRVIQNKIEDLIAKKMLSDEIKKDIPFQIKPEEIS